MLYGRRGTGRDSDELKVHINDECDVDLDVNTQEMVTYERYLIDAYVTFYDDGDGETTFSITDIDDLIEALGIIKRHHIELVNADPDIDQANRSGC